MLVPKRYDTVRHEGAWCVVRLSDGVIVYRSPYENGIGTGDCRIWIHRKLNGSGSLV